MSTAAIYESRYRKWARYALIAVFLVVVLFPIY